MVKPSSLMSGPSVESGDRSGIETSSNSGLRTWYQIKVNLGDRAVESERSGETVESFGVTPEVTVKLHIDRYQFLIPIYLNNPLIKRPKSCHLNLPLNIPMVMVIIPFDTS